MFTGIVEELGTIISVEEVSGNLILGVQCQFIDELKVDQSIAHDGICLTVDKILDDRYTVTAIAETMDKTNIGSLEQGSKINLERCMVAGDRLDGHIVQGHVDLTAQCVEKLDRQGSWEFTFEYEKAKGNTTVEKGSICVNGVSLTVVKSDDQKHGRFSVAIIPYTYESTKFKFTSVGDVVNLEFDIIGKYVEKIVRER
jgi:riboflavin synthase